MHQKWRACTHFIILLFRCRRRVPSSPLLAAALRVFALACARTASKLASMSHAKRVGCSATAAATSHKRACAQAQNQCNAHVRVCAFALQAVSVRT